MVGQTATHHNRMLVSGEVASCRQRILSGSPGPIDPLRILLCRNPPTVESTANRGAETNCRTLRSLERRKKR